MKDYSQMMGQPIEWRVNGLFKQDWRLYYNETLVASILTRKYLSLDRDARDYDGIPIQMTYDRNHHRLTLRKSMMVDDWNNQKYHENSWELDGKSGREYGTSKSKWKVLHGSLCGHMGVQGRVVPERRDVAITKTVCKRTYPQSSEFHFAYSRKEDPINPWLLALFGQHRISRCPLRALCDNR